MRPLSALRPAWWWLALIGMALATPTWADRQPIFDQIDLPHPYYYHEMYLPQLTGGPASVAFSPDAREVVYSMAGSLWRQRLDSGVAVQLTDGPGYDYQPDWSPDGRSIVYVSYQAGALELWLLDVATGKTKQLTNGGAVTWNFASLPVGQVTNLTLIVAAPAAGSITNVATVASTNADPNLTNNVTPPVVTGVTPVADVVVLNAGPTNVVAGTLYTNTISVTNAGPSVATNVVVVDTRPDGTTVTNTYPVLAAGVGTNFIVTYTAPGSGPLTNAAIPLV